MRRDSRRKTKKCLCTRLVQINMNCDKSFLTYCNKSKMNANVNHVTVNTSIGYDNRTVNCTGFGHGCDVTADFGLAVGAYAYVCEPCGVALGPYTRVKHENSVVIGQHIESKNPNSVLISDVEFRNGSISIENDSLLILGNNKNYNFVCGACYGHIRSGVRWNSDNNISNEENPPELTSGLCFNCIHDCVLQFRAKENWAEEYGDPISELKKDIQELKEKMKKYGMSY